MDTSKIEVTEDDGIRSGGYDLKLGDIVTVDKVCGDRWVRLGWAKDADTGEQGERIPGARLINADGSLGRAVKVVEPDDLTTQSSG